MLPFLYHNVNDIPILDLQKTIKSFPKERLEVFCGGGVLQLDNFRKLKGFGWKGFKSMNLRRQDKGQKACAQAFLDAVRGGGVSPISAEEIFEVARVSVEVAKM